MSHPNLPDEQEEARGMTAQFTVTRHNTGVPIPLPLCSLVNISL